MEKLEEQRDFDLTGVLIEAELTTSATDGVTGWLSIRQGDEGLRFVLDLTGYVTPDLRGQVLRLSANPFCDDFWGVELPSELFRGQLTDLSWVATPGDREGHFQAINVDWRSGSGDRVGLNFWPESGMASSRKLE